MRVENLMTKSMSTYVDLHVNVLFRHTHIFIKMCVYNRTYADVRMHIHMRAKFA